MDDTLTSLREQLIQKILNKQDSAFRWGYDSKKAQERPQYRYYSPNYRSTLWTLILLADLQAPPDHPQIQAALNLISERFYHPEFGMFTLPNESHFPLPCLNGNMIYLYAYFNRGETQELSSTISFFSKYQRFDDGDYKTPKTFPYFSNTACYGKHTCYWGVTKLFKGISFIPKAERSPDAQNLLEQCLNFILKHEVCFSSKKPEKILHQDAVKLSFPNFYKTDLLELLWLLDREEIHDSRTWRALDLLLSKRNADGTWNLEKTINTVVSLGTKGSPNPWITERANNVLKNTRDNQ